MRQIIQRVQDILLKKKSNAGSNLIISGYRVTNSEIEAYFPNTLMNILRSPIWEKIPGVLGEDLTFYILRYFSVFLRLPNNNYMQLVGPPMYAWTNRRSKERKKKGKKMEKNGNRGKTENNRKKKY